MKPGDCGYLIEVQNSVGALAEMAFREDMPEGDITAQVLRLRGKQATAALICREPVYMCGSAWFEQVLAAFFAFDPMADLHMVACFEDGERLPAGSVLFRWEGDVASILAVERTFLNFLGRAIGIANAVGRYVEEVRKYNDHTQILDTRKTQPGYRWFDKYAVLCGGGRNHRLNLSDQVLIKENHIAKLNGVGEALSFVRENLHKDIGIQIEVETMDELKEALAHNCPIIMLDNFTPAQVEEACRLPRGNSLIEVSGGVTLETIGAYCSGKPDRISIGAVTHSIKAPDLSLLIEEA